MEMFLKRNARIVAVLMTLILIVGLMPVLGMQAYAEDKDELPKLPDNDQILAITAGSSVLSTNAGQQGLQKVYFGTVDGGENHEWYVIAYDGKDGSGNKITYDAPGQNDVPLYDERTVTLFHKDLGDKTLYRNADGTGEHDIDYDGSDLQKSIDNWIDSDDDCKFDTPELGSIYHVTLKGGAVLHDDNGMAGPDVEDARLWPLSLVQTQLLPDDVFTGYNDDQYFWTRTPGNDDGYVTVFNNDRHSDNEAFISDSDMFMRPAVALEMGEILFTSTAKGSKDFSDDDLGTMKEVQPAPDGNDEWKMTLRAGRMGNFRASVAKKQDDTVTISYTDAVPFGNSYVSAVIKNKKTQEILYYGRLCKVTANSQKDGKATLKLPPDSVGSQNLLYVFNEEVNGDCRSDYASEPIWLDLSDESTVEPAPEMVYGTSVLAADAGQQGLQKVYFGKTNGYQNHKWYVLSYDGHDGDGDPQKYQLYDGTEKPIFREGTITLVYQFIQNSTIFGDNDDEKMTCSEYKDSKLQAVFSTLVDKVNGQFWGAELDAIKSKTLEGGSAFHGYKNPDYHYDANLVNGPDVEDQLVWPLSEAEVKCLPYEVRENFGTQSYFWTRSPGNYSGWVITGGRSLDLLQSYVEAPRGILPGLDLDMNKILFTSSADGGKDFDDKDLGTMRALKETTTDEWKLTIHDETRDRLKAASSTRKGNTLEISYEGAVTGSNSYVSAAVLGDSNALIYYGRLKKADADEHASGELTVKLPDDFDNKTYKLYVFCEEINADTESDLSSQLIKIEVPESKERPDAKAKNTLKVKGKTVTVSAAMLRKRTQTIERSSAIKVTGAKGTVTYKLTGVKAAKYKKYFKVNKKNGSITVKKGLKKGTYKLKVKVSAAGNSKYKAGTKTAAVTVKVRKITRIPGNG